MLMAFEQIVSSYIYYPDPHWITTPDRLGLQSEEVLMAVEPRVRLHAWFFPRQIHWLRSSFVTAMPATSATGWRTCSTW